MRNTPAPQRGIWATYVLAARKNAGPRLSQAELARRLGVDRSTIWRWETGQSKPEDADIVAQLAEVLDLDLEEALAAAGLRPGVSAPAEPTRDIDEEIDLVRTDPQLTDSMKVRIIEMIF